MRAGYHLSLHAFLLTALFGSAGQAGAASFKYTPLNSDQTVFPTPNAINSSDAIVGNAELAADDSLEGFVWSDGILTLVPGTNPLVAINNAGIAVGEPSKTQPDYASYNLNNGVLTDVPVPFARGKAYVYADGITPAGDVVGVVSYGKGKPTGFVSSKGSTMKLLPPGSKQSTIWYENKSGALLINCGDAYCNPYFLYSHGKFTRISVPGASITDATFITDSGAVGGSFMSSGSAAQAFLYSDGTYTTFTPPNAASSFATGVGPSGQVVGRFTDTNGNTHGFLSYNGTIHQIDGPNATYTTINAIGPSGAIIGNYGTPNGYFAYIATCPKKDVCTQ